MHNDTLIVIPTYDERDNIEPITRAARASAPWADILVVDDGSPDGTGELALQLAAADPHLHVLQRPGKLGLGTAYLDGFRWGLARDYAFFVEMDADFSHDPSYLPDLVGRARTRADVVIGSRWTQGGGTRNWGLGRRIVSRGGSLYAGGVLGLPLRDVTAGFVCYRREVLETLALEDIRSEGYGFQIEMKYRAWQQGFRLEEMPIVFEDRRVGQSKMSSRIVLEALFMVWRLRQSSSSSSSRSSGSSNRSPSSS